MPHTFEQGEPLVTERSIIAAYVGRVYHHVRDRSDWMTPRDRGEVLDTVIHVYWLFTE